jgi:hypothetical protein
MTALLPLGTYDMNQASRMAFRSSALFTSSFGINTLNHAVSTWSDEHDRTIFAFEPRGLLKRDEILEDGSLRLPNEQEALEALEKVGDVITRLMREHFATHVLCEPELVTTSHC